jgi:hypothetical protein
MEYKENCDVDMETSPELNLFLQNYSFAELYYTTGNGQLVKITKARVSADEEVIVLS